MVNSCVVVGCTTAYGDAKRTLPEGVTVYSFPPEKDKERRLEWIANIGREDWQPTENSVVCSLHFTPESFKKESTDTNKWRQKKRKETADAEGSSQYTYRCLKKNAVPTEFPPIYAEKHRQPTPKTERTDATHADSRRTVQQREREEQNEEFLAKDKVHSLEDIDKKFNDQSEIFPGGFTHCKHEANLVLLLLEYPASRVPQLRASISVNSQLTYSVVIDGRLVPLSKCDTDRTGTIRHFTKLTNIMTQVKQWVEEENAPKPNPLEIAKVALEEYLDEAEDKPVLARKVAFLLEQIQLLGRNKFGRRYSPHLLALAETIRVCSTQAYRALRDLEIITLPSTETLDRIVRNLTVETGPSSLDYLKARVRPLKTEELYCTIMIDEIHCASKMEFSGAQGTIVGQTEDGEVAKTMLCFMVSSLRGKYRDIVGMYAIAGLTAQKQLDAFFQVLQLVCDAGLKPIAVVTDNLRTNYSFMKKLGNEKLLTRVDIPENHGRPLFLLFDYVHNIKNIYTNWIKPNLRFFDMPPMPNSGLQTAKFSDIRDLYGHELGKPLKMAHKLLKRALAPNNLERPNVSLAVSVFHESTRDALEWYTRHEGKDWQGTSDFIAMIVRLWDIQNVRTLKKGKHKRNVYQDPLSDPNGRQIQFLMEFADFLQTWQDSGKKGLLGGLTGDTFRAVRHTCRAMVELARYCLEGLGWDFVMLGHCSSDRLEGHFSAYRQTHGGNFLIGVKQILESEKKLRAISLLRYSKCSLNDLKDLQGIDTVRSATALTIANDLSPRVEEALTSTPREPNNTDLNIILYVSGAMVRSHISCTKGCGPCQRLLLNNGGGEQMPNLSTDGKVAPAVAEFIEQVNRGGLLVPSSLAFGLGMKAWRVFECIKKDEELRAEFLKATNHRAIFVETVLNLIEDESEIEEVLINELTCAEGHKFGRVLITKFFHCMVKNWTKEMSTAVPEKKGTQRKVAKLTSQTAK